MGKAKLLQTNFTGGELSPLMMGRTDTVKYQNGAAKLTNMLVRQQGGLWKREGTKYVGEVKDSSKKVILYEFEYSDIQAYLLEIGENYFRIWYDGGFVETSPGSGIPLEVTTVYTESQLNALTFAQSADVLFVCHPEHPPRKIQRLGANSWNIVDCVFLDGPYTSILQPETTLRITDYTSVAKAESNTALFVAAITAQSIISVAYTAGQWVFTTAAAHGHVSGATIRLTDVSYTLNQGYARENRSLIGEHIITVTAVNKFYLPNALIPVTVYLWNLTGALIQTVAVNHIEYRKNNTLFLAKILAVDDNKHADLFVFTNVKNDIARSVTVNGAGTASNSGVFTQDDIGKYIKITPGTWHQITAFTSDSQVTLSAAIGILAYTPATTFIAVTDPIRQAKIVSTNDLFAITDIGRAIRFNFGGKRPWGKIVTYIDAKNVLVRFEADIPVDPLDVNNFYDSGITQIFDLGAWSETLGYPHCVTFHEQRLWFGGTESEPLTIWGSQPNDYENFAPTEYDSVVLDTSAISYTLVANKANPIIWMQSGPVLIVGTLGSEWQVKAASSVNQPITPTNINITPQTNHGSLIGCRPVKLGSAILFVQRAGHKAIEFLYDFNQDAYVGKNLTVVSDHILRQGGGAVTLGYQREPNNIVWVALADGTLAALTYEQDQQVMAWHSHVLGGNGFVESLVGVGSISGTSDTLYLLVKRIIDGTTKRYIECLTPDFYPANEVDLSSMFFLDCGLTYDGVPTDNVTGADHLEGESVSVMADGVYLGEKTVTAGEVLLGVEASVVHIGYKYTGLARVLPLEGGAPGGGTAQGKMKRVAKTMVRVYNTLDFKYGTSLQNLDVKRMVDGNGTPVNKLVTDDLSINIPMAFNYTAMFYLVQDLPYPFVVLSVAPDVEVTT